MSRGVFNIIIEYFYFLGDVGLEEKEDLGVHQARGNRAVQRQGGGVPASLVSMVSPLPIGTSPLVILESDR